MDDQETHHDDRNLGKLREKIFRKSVDTGFMVWYYSTLRTKKRIWKSSQSKLSLKAKRITW